MTSGLRGPTGHSGGSVEPVHVIIVRTDVYRAICTNGSRGVSCHTRSQCASPQESHVRTLGPHVHGLACVAVVVAPARPGGARQCGLCTDCSVFSDGENEHDVYKHTPLRSVQRQPATATKRRRQCLTLCFCAQSCGIAFKSSCVQTTALALHFCNAGTSHSTINEAAHPEGVQAKGRARGASLPVAEGFEFCILVSCADVHRSRKITGERPQDTSMMFHARRENPMQCNHFMSSQTMERASQDFETASLS